MTFILFTPHQQKTLAPQLNFQAIFSEIEHKGTYIHNFKSLGLNNLIIMRMMRYLMRNIMNRKVNLLGHAMRHNFITNIFEGKVVARDPEPAQDNPFLKT